MMPATERPATPTPGRVVIRRPEADHGFPWAVMERPGAPEYLAVLRRREDADALAQAPDQLEAVRVLAGLLQRWDRDIPRVPGDEATPVAPDSLRGRTHAALALPAVKAAVAALQEVG